MSSTAAVLTLDDAQTRLMNLIVMLEEDAEDLGAVIPPIPSHAYLVWSEEQIRQYFDTYDESDLHAWKDRVSSFPSCEGPSGDLDGGEPGYTPMSASEASAVFTSTDDAAFTAWFPGLERSKTASANPRARILCFPNAGNEENLYTNEGVGARKVDTLLAFCRSQNIEVLAVQLPGRAQRRSEPFAKSARDAATAVLNVVGHRLFGDGKPYYILAHSVGTWVSYELLQAMKEKRLPMPVRCFLSAFPSPTWPANDRPWVQQRSLADPAFMDEARGWDVNEVVFSKDMFGMYGPIMRADFTLFDEYEYGHAEDPKLPVALTTFYAKNDKKVTQDMVKAWVEVCDDVDGPHMIDGHHLYVMGLGDQKAGKIKWLEMVVERLKKELTS